MKAQKAAQRGTIRAPRRIFASHLAVRRFIAPLLVMLLALWPVVSFAEEQAQILATEEQGFGRLVIQFPDRMDLPTYRVKYDNGVLAIEFDSPLPSLCPTLPC